MLSYETTMAIGRAHYQDVLDALAAAGLSAIFTQTGGMCAALEVLLEGGQTLLVTDAEDSLAWDRSVHCGWGVGLYPPDHADTGGTCLAFRSSPDGSPGSLLPLVYAVLADACRARPRQTLRSSPQPNAQMR